MTAIITKSLPGIETGEEKQQVQAENKRSEQKSIPTSKSDSFVSSNGKKNEKIDPEKDGKFTFKQVGRNFIKGLLSPITSMFSSIKGFLIGAGMLIGGALLTAATGGAILPAFIAMGVVFGACEGAKGIYKIAIAKNGDDIEEAFLDFGTGISGILTSLVGARASLKMSGQSTEGINMLQATINCFKECPTSIKNSWSMIADGTGKQRLINLLFRKEPRVAVVDNYTDMDGNPVNSFSISGSGINDTSHGEAVEAVLRGACPHAKVKRLNFKNNGDPNSFIDNANARISRFKILTKRVNKGVHYDSVNVSSGTGMSIEQLGEITGISSLSPESIHLHAVAIRQFLLDIKNKPIIMDVFNKQTGFRLDTSQLEISYKTFIEEFKALEELAKKVKLITIASGNQGPNWIHLCSFTKGTKLIGATNAQGLKTDFTQIHGLVTDFKQGIFNVCPVYKDGNLVGYSLLKRGTVELPITEVRRGESVVREFVGKKIHDVLGEFYEVNRKLVDITDELRLKGYSKDQIKFAEIRGPFLTAHKGNDYYCKTDKNSRVIFDPACSGETDAVSCIQGTSFASPYANGLKLSELFPTWSSVKDSLSTAIAPLAYTFNALMNLFSSKNEKVANTTA